MGMVQEFKTFALRGNVVDLAVGIVIGAAFGRIVTTLVNNVIMPPLGLVLGGVDFSNLKLVLKQGATDATGKSVGEVAIGYGVFINAVIDFLIVAFAIFLLVKLINSMHKQEAAKPSEPSTQEKLLTEIRDELRSDRGRRAA